MVFVTPPNNSHEDRVIVSGSTQEPEEYDMRDELAEYAHAAWSGWMRYMFSKCSSTEEGELLIPPWAVARWTRQMSTPYKELPLREQMSDLDEADKMIAIVDKWSGEEE